MYDLPRMGTHHVIRWLRAAVCLAVLGLATVASADTFGLITGGDEAKQPVVETELGPWLRANGHDEVRVGTAALPQGDIAEVIQCFILADQRCAQKFVAGANLDGLMFVMVEVDRDASAGADRIKVTGWLYGGDGSPIAAQALFCNDCRNDTLKPKLQELARLLFSAAATGSGRLSVITRPSGATVLVDGEKIGVSPVTTGLREGPHTVTLERPGYQTVTRPITVKNDAESPIEVDLVSLSTGGGKRGSKKPLAYGALGLGGAAIVTGAVLVFVVDEDDTPTPTADEFYTDAGLPGALTLGAGVAVAAVGGYLLYSESKRPKATTPTASVSSRGAVFGLAGHF